jgi:hypothetical protein
MAFSVASRDKGTVKPPALDPTVIRGKIKGLGQPQNQITPTPRGNTGPFKPGIPTKSPRPPITRGNQGPMKPSMPAASDNGDRMQRNAARVERQRRMIGKLQSSGGKVDRKQKDRLMRAAKSRMGKG